MPKRRGKYAALAVLSIAAGAILTLDNFGVTSGAWRLWPIFPLFLGAGGILFFGVQRTAVAAGRHRRKTNPIPLGIGTYLVMVSLFFLYLNYTRWGVLSRAWPAFIGFFGLSVIVVSVFSEKKRWFVASGLFLTLLSICFFMIFTLDARLWPVSFILFGIWILLMPQGQRSITDEKSCSNS